MNYLKLVLPAILLALSISVNATVLNTLSGQQYEWLELTETTGKSRVEVEALLNDVNSSLYGYEYASRSLVESLFLSYTFWDGLEGFHGDPGVIAGISSMLNDFGTTDTFNDSSNVFTHNTVDGYTVNYTGYSSLGGFMGTSSECGTYSCRAYTAVYNYNGTDVMAHQNGGYGWDSENQNPLVLNREHINAYSGSFLVRPSVVPVPAAAWLFGSALLGFFGVSRRKEST